MSYIKQVEVLDDEEKYHQSLENARRWGEMAKRSVKIPDECGYCVEVAKRAAHYAREAMKYRAVM